MRPALLPLLVLAAAGCRPSSSHQGTAPPPPEASNPAPRPTPAAEGSTTPAPVPLRVDAKQTECVDRWLKGHGLDDYGNPQGTMYAGGTPTFDETTGKSVDRWTLVMKNRPEALQSCAVPLPP